MSEFYKGMILGLIIGVILSLLCVFIPFSTLLFYYKIGLIPATLLILLSIVLGARYKSKKNKNSNDNQNHPSKPRGNAEERVWVLMITRFPYFQAMIAIAGSWVSVMFLSYLLFEYFWEKRYKI